MFTKNLSALFMGNLGDTDISDLSSVFRKYADNFSELNFDSEDEETMMGANPNAFTVSRDFNNIKDSTNVTREMLEELFEEKPKAKVFNIKVSPRFDPLNPLSIGGAGGTIRISGKF